MESKPWLRNDITFPCFHNLGAESVTRFIQSTRLHLQLCTFFIVEFPFLEVSYSLLDLLAVCTIQKVIIALRKVTLVSAIHAKGALRRRSCSLRYVGVMNRVHCL